VKVKKQWAGALLSVNCCCFVQKPSHNFELAGMKKKKKRKKILAIWLFHNAFSRHWTGHAVHHENT